MVSKQSQVLEFKLLVWLETVYVYENNKGISYNLGVVQPIVALNRKADEKFLL